MLGLIPKLKILQFVAISYECTVLMFGQSKQFKDLFSDFQAFSSHKNDTQKGWTLLSNLPGGSHQTPPAAGDASWDQPKT